MRTEDVIANNVLQAAIECACPDCKKKIPGERARKGKWVHKLAGGRTRDCKASELMSFKLDPSKLMALTISTPVKDSEWENLSIYLGTKSLIPDFKREFFKELYEGRFTHKFDVSEIRSNFDMMTGMPTYDITVNEPDGRAREFKEVYLQDFQRKALEQMLSGDTVIAPRRMMASGRYAPMPVSGIVTKYEVPCEACNGVGHIDGAECWHCEGTGVDPVKT